MMRIQRVGRIWALDVLDVETETVFNTSL